MLLLPAGVWAASTDSIHITASSNNSTAVTNFVVTGEPEDTWIDTEGSWTAPDDSEYVVIRRSFDDYPDDPDNSGTLVYQGTLEEFAETVSGIGGVEAIYYTAWSYNGSMYSEPVYYLLEVETTMVDVMTLGIFILLPLAASIACLVGSRGRELLAIIAGFGWLILGVWSFGQYSSVWDIYYSIGFFSLCMVLLFVLISAGMYARYRKNSKGDYVAEENWGEDEGLRLDMIEEEKEEEKMNRMFGKSRKRKKKSSSKFDLRGEI